MIPTPSITVVSDGLAKLTDAFRNKAVVSGIAKTHLAMYQDLENVSWQVINAILNPTGDMLDRLAAIAGETRQGRSDTEFLAAYQLRVRVNNSKGLAEDIIQIARLMLPTAKYYDFSTAWLVEAFNVTAPRTFISLLHSASDGGVLGVINYSVWDPSLNLVWDSVYGGVSPTTVLDSIYNPSGVGHVTMNDGLLVASENV